MIWTVIADNNLILVESNFADGVFKQEHSTLRVTSKANREILLLVENEVVSAYDPDENKLVYIDLTDFFATKEIGNLGGLIKVATPIGGTTKINYEVKGLRNPQYMEIPVSLNDVLNDMLSIIPPKKWLEPLFGLNDKVELYRKTESLPNATVLQLAYIRTSPYGVTEMPIEYNVVGSYDVPSSILRNDIGLQLLNNGDFVAERIFKRCPLLCKRSYAAVEWQSRSGVIKRHTWEVRNIKDTIYNAVELQTRFNSYRENKGYEETIVLHLDGLTRYDYWYYSDIITSSDVRVAMNEVDADFGEDTRVQVLTKSAEQPNANRLYELNIEIKYKRYGRV